MRPSHLSSRLDLTASLVWRRNFEVNYRAGRDLFPDVVPMTGIYVTLVSGLLEILGWEMFLLALGTDPRRFGELVNRYAAWVGQYFEALALADVDVVMVHDDMVWTSGPPSSTPP